MTSPVHRLDGDVALVTGASRGIGAATARILAEMGAQVACVARSRRNAASEGTSTVDDIVDEISSAGGRAAPFGADLSHDDSIDTLVDAVIDVFGRVDILVNNAGVTVAGDYTIDMRRHDLVTNVNLRAPMLLLRRTLPAMCSRGRGSVINVSSATAINVFPRVMSYGMAKAALERMTVDIAAQVAGSGVSVNALRVDIPIASEGATKFADDDTFADWDRPEVAAEAMAWIATRPASFTGQLVSLLSLREIGALAGESRSKPFPGQVMSQTIGVVDRHPK